MGRRDETLIKAIEPYLHNSDDRVRANALETLGRVYKGYDKEKFLTFLNDSNNRVMVMQSLFCVKIIDVLMNILMMLIRL